MATRTRRNATTVNVEADFSRGMIRDVPRHAIPAGGVYDSTDFLLHQPGVAQKRGGTSYDVDIALAVGVRSWAGIVDHNDAKVVLGDNGHIYTISGDLGGSTLADAYAPVRWSGGTKNLIVFPNSGGPVKWDGSAAPAALAGSPPSGTVGGVYKEHLLLANTSTNPGRLYFSPLPDVESTWDTTNSWIDFSDEIRGLAEVGDYLFVLGAKHIYRVVGSSPPPNSDMTVSQFLDIGVMSSTGVGVCTAVSANYLYFASTSGVYRTNGSTLENLTQKGGMESYWRSRTSSTPGASGRFASVGVLHNEWLFVNLSSSTGQLLCYLPTTTWMRLTNVNKVVTSSGSPNFLFPSLAGDELYATDKTSVSIRKLSTVLSTSDSFKNDADGTAVAPMLETRVLGRGPTLKHFGRGHVTYFMGDLVTDNPTMAVSVAPGLDATTYTAVSESPLAETSSPTTVRAPFTIGKVSQGISIKFQQTNASNNAAGTYIKAIEYEERPLAPVEGGQ